MKGLFEAVVELRVPCLDFFSGFLSGCPVLFRDTVFVGQQHDASRVVDKAVGMEHRRHCVNESAGEVQILRHEDVSASRGADEGFRLFVFRAALRVEFSAGLSVQIRGAFPDHFNGFSGCAADVRDRTRTAGGVNEYLHFSSPCIHPA